MEPVDVVMWLDICVCLPLTILVIFWVCCVVRKDQVPVIYYTNLLISNLIQICTMIIWVVKVRDNQTLIICQIFINSGMMTSLCFKMCIALERYFFITCPLLDCVRQTKGSVLVCFLIWALCITTAPIAILLDDFVHIYSIALLPAPLFILSLAGTVKALPAATSVSTEEKRRIVGTLILLFLNYFLMILPTLICYILIVSGFIHIANIAGNVFILFLLSPYAYLILFIVMRKGPIDKLLVCLCTAASIASDQQCEWWK